MNKFLIIFLLLASTANAQEAITAIRDNTTRTNIATVSALGSKYGLGVDTIPATTIYSGQVTVETQGESVQVSATSTAIRSVCIKAHDENVGKIYVGNATVTSATGYVLLADSSVCMEIGNLNLIYLDTNSDGDKVTYLAVN